MNTSAFLAGFWTITVSGLIGSACAIIGCYLLLRRLSLLSDVISHSILPGIVIGYLLTGSTTTGVIVGAIFGAMVSAIMSDYLRAEVGLAVETSLGVTSASLFALGILLLSAFVGHGDLDPDCVIYGQLDLVPLDLVTIAGWHVPRAFIVALIQLPIVLLATLVFWKEFKLVSFDPMFATAIGFSARTVGLVMTIAVSILCVLSFESIGSILVVGMMTIPAAIGYLASRRLVNMIVWAVVSVWIASVLGYAFAYWTNTTSSGSVTVMLGVLLLGAILFAPEHGVIAQFYQRIKLKFRITAEDTLSRIYRAEEANQPITWQSAHPLGVSKLLYEIVRRYLLSNRMLEQVSGEPKLLPKGRQIAKHLVRVHRLWESYVGKHFDIPLDHLHASAERVEHFVDQDLREEIAAGVEGTLDPHGKLIPPASDS